MTTCPATKSAARSAISIAGGYRGVLITELAKCELVCAYCHAVRTYMRREVMRSGSPSIEEEAIRYTLN